MDIEIDTGIKFKSFIVLNRYIDRSIFLDPKLLSLIIYVALRVKRSNNITEINAISLKIGEFIIGRLTTVKEVGLTDAEYRTRFRKLQELRIIEIVKTTNKFTIGRWLENTFIDVNLEYPIFQNNQPTNQQITSQLTTNNNINNDTHKHTSISNDEYRQVIDEYMKCKGIRLQGEEIKDTAYVIKKMFNSSRRPDEIIKFMTWLRSNENKEEYPWIKGWTINTVQKKIAEFVAGKLKVRTWEDEYPRFK